MFRQDCTLKIIPDLKSTVLFYYSMPTFILKVKQKSLFAIK